MLWQKGDNAFLGLSHPPGATQPSAESIKQRQHVGEVCITS